MRSVNVFCFNPRHITFLISNASGFSWRVWGIWFFSKADRCKSSRSPQLWGAPAFGDLEGIDQPSAPYKWTTRNLFCLGKWLLPWHNVHGMTWGGGGGGSSVGNSLLENMAFRKRIRKPRVLRLNCWKIKLKGSELNRRNTRNVEIGLKTPYWHHQP